MEKARNHFLMHSVLAIFKGGYFLSLTVEKNSLLAFPSGYE